MITELVFDVETQRLFSDIETDDPGDLGVSVVSVYRRELTSTYGEIRGEMRSFWDPIAGRSPVLEQLWDWFPHADRIIGFNSKKFDVPVLERYAPIPIAALPHFDMLEKVHTILGRRIGLEALARETLGRTKTDIGIHAVQYWKKCDAESLKKLQEYCEADVLLTRDLYDYGLKHKLLKYRDRWNNPADIPIDFSYPPDTMQTKQIGLF